MSKIVISGYYGFANAGDEAMLTAIIKSLRSKESNVQLTVISGNPEFTASKYRVNSIHRFNFLSIISALKESDLLLSGGGSLLQDVTSKRSLLYYLFIIGIGRFLNKKVMLFAQGIGPINSCFLRKLTKKVCSKADLITVRDTDSLTELKRIGINDSKVQLTADAVLTLPKADTGQGKILLKQASVPLHKKLIVISVRQWQKNNYLTALAQGADILAEKYDAHIVFLPLQHAADKEICTLVQSEMKNSADSTVLDVKCDTEQFLSVIGNADLMIGMRLHALVFASVMEIPFAALSYDPKIEGFVKEISGISAGDVNELTCDSIVSAAEKALLGKEQHKQNLAQLRRKALLNTNLAFNLLRN